MFTKNKFRRLMGADTGAGSGAASSDSTVQEQYKNTGDEGNESNNKGKSFDDFLSDRTYQAEFDRRIAKALNTAREKWESTKAEEIAVAKTEAEKFAKMNADQKAAYEQKKRIEEIEKREREINTRELKATAYETLASKGLPKSLIDTIDFKDADSCNSSIEAVEKAFKLAVEEEVNKALRGKSTPKTSKITGESSGGDFMDVIKENQSKRN